jgi:hypothetical protein
VTPGQEVSVMLFDGTYKNAITLFLSKGEPSLRMSGIQVADLKYDKSCVTGKGADTWCGFYGPGRDAKYLVPSDAGPQCTNFCK